ncbi:hypothetical protein P171DRAFT_426806 [Karstenula rhodostoma CBS 690.94]|uniref:DUF7357 domain-containing protein n=1 Tax=Karstenula rhodostoma CBS 690.94 TaxID=1392251 RepID=A0A9P4UFU9_9PLEO|nr:hypothetical protein P171DRAFT_426806 [Karstenula rhodostoma CBS 690.94]
MRLRLSVQRNNLPVSNILWSVPDTASAQAYTFARLLEDVNRILPLEAEQWGLEDYIVELEGFECLHFSPVLQTLKEDDRLSIRPLLTAEVRSRTLTGRTQISEDGRHLVDGIPFGRPYLRQPLRPAVSIPPRKRLRVDEDTAADTEAPESAGFITAAAEAGAQSPIASPGAKKNRKEVQFSQADEEGSDDSEDDEDFVPGHVSEGSVDSESDDDSSSAVSEASAQAPESSGRRSPEHEASDTSSASETDISSDSSSESDSDSPSEADLKVEASVGSESDSDSDSDSTDSGSDSDSDSDSSTPEVLSSKLPVPPWSGSKNTRRRNFRRKQLVKLNQLKAEGKLHPDATYTDLQEYLGTPKEPVSPIRTPAHVMSKSTGKRKRLGEDADQHAQTQVDESAELERRREELMARLTNTAPDVEMTPVESLSSTVEQAEQSASVSASSATTAVSTSKKDAATSAPPAKRLRPNVSAIGRILQRQAVNVERKTSKSVQPTVVDPEPEGASDPDFWKSRINLSAFECWDEEHELSAPPFPFEQHWDPASKLMREKKQTKQKKRARKSEQPTELLVYDNEDQEPEETPILDYDDSPETMKAASDPTDAAESQILQEVELAAKSDLPPLPEDVESLAMLQPHDIQVGAVVVFKVYAIDPVTVTPHISDYKTAVVEKEGDSGHGAGTFRLKLADRDIPHKASEVVDEKGRSVKNAVSGFRMNDEDEDEDEDNSVWEGTFGELVEPKLLKAAV